MSQRVSETPETVVEIVDLTNYMIECRDVTMYNLREQIRNTSESVLFLMEYAHLPSNILFSCTDFNLMFRIIISVTDIHLICRALMWPKDMEAVLELAFSRIQIRRDKAEKVLRKKRIMFDAKLDKHQKQLDMFRKKDPPLLTMDDMIESVATIEEIVANLQVMLLKKPNN